MLMTEFNIDIAKEVWQEEAREDGREEGRIEGREEGREEGITEAAEKYEQLIADKDAEIAKLAALVKELQSSQ